MSDERAVATCISCGIKFRYPKDRQHVRCPKCKAVNVLQGDPLPSGRPVTEAAQSPEVFFAAVTPPAVTAMSPSAVLKRTAVAGVLLGLLLAIALCVLRPSVGISRLIMFVGLLASLPVIQIVIQLLRVPDPNASQPAIPTLSSHRRLLTFEIAVLVLPCLVLIVEFFAPTSGIVALLSNSGAKSKSPGADLSAAKIVINVPQHPEFTRPPSERAKRPKKTKEPKSSATEPPVAKPSTDRQLWAKADFLLVNPTHYAVGIRDSGEPGRPAFEVLVKGEDEVAKEAQKIAWDQKTPVIGIDRNLTRAVYQKYAPPEKLEGDLSTQVTGLFERRLLVPKKTTLVAYYDTINNVQRVGHLMKDAAEQFEFAELLPRRGVVKDQPFETEQIVRAQRVKPESEQHDLNDLSLRSSVDWLDYCVYQVLRTIQYASKEQYQTGEPFVFVDDVVADVSDYEARLEPYKNMRNEALAELKRDSVPVRTESLIGLFSRVVIDREEELSRRSFRDDRRNELLEEVRALKEQINQLRGLIDAEKRLTSEIRGRLVRTGIKQVERSERAQKLITNKVSGKNWIKPNSEDAVTSNLVQATHLLLTDIRHPERSGKYQLSMRVVDVLTGEILWEDQGDRTGSPLSPGTLGGPDGVAELASSSTDKTARLGGSWRSPNGGRAKIVEDESGVLHVTVTMSAQDTVISITATRKNEYVTVNSSSATVSSSSRSVTRRVRTKLRIVDSQSIDIGCESVTFKGRNSVSVGDFHWTTFRRE